MNAMTEENIKEKIVALLPFLNEKLSRLYLGSEAKSLGRGGISKISKLTGVKRSTIARGINELSDYSIDDSRVDMASNKIRKPGGGRKSIRESQPTVVGALLNLVEGNSSGNPLKWTTKSLRNLSLELKKEGYKIGYNVVGKLLEEEGFSLQPNQKVYQTGDQYPDRDKQFNHINDLAKEYLKNKYPVVFIDCKKNAGNFRNTGTESALNDLPLPDKATPYGVSDAGANEDFVNVGISSDTAEFVFASLRTWWKTMGKEKYPDADKLLIITSGGSSNGSIKLWKKCLQEFANEEKMEITVSHFPPGTSKWNKIEHRLSSQITKNLQGLPPETFEIIVNLIASTTTDTGCTLDSKIYETSIKLTDEEFCGSWNYVIKPSMDAILKE